MSVGWASRSTRRTAGEPLTLLGRSGTSSSSSQSSSSLNLPRFIVNVLLAGLTPETDFLVAFPTEHSPWPTRVPHSYAGRTGKQASWASDEVRGCTV